VPGVAGKPLRSAAEAAAGRSTSRVAFVSDRALVAEGLRRLARGVYARSVVVRPDDAIRGRVGAFGAEVAVVDSGIEGAADLVRALAASAERCGVVAIGDASAARAMELLSAGALVYLDGEATVGELEQALDAAARGEGLVPPRLVGELLRRALFESRWSERGQPLTGREAEVAALLRAELSNKEIARRLQIEVSTVKNHVHSILVKLGLHGRGEIARWHSDAELTLHRSVRSRPRSRSRGRDL
jgi:two-component system, NarL family, nitrate/nitrite response regulator NarL